jgi:GAF domain-containing protein
MPARFSAYPPDAAALMRVLEDDTVYRIGRSPSCELRIDHVSVSRFHAELLRNDRCWRMEDTASKNGLRVDGTLVLHAELEEPTWFAVGDVHCWLEPLDTAAVAAMRAQGESRRSVSRALSAQISSHQEIGTLLPQTLAAVLELCGLERGFVLYGGPGEAMRVRASHGIELLEIAATGFAGSAAAVERALVECHTVVCCDTLESPWLGSRPSVRLGGIRALVCLPLRLGDKPLGAIYADSRRPGPALTELDIELIENVAQHAAAALAAARLQREVQQVLDAAQAAGMAAPRWDELRQPTKA